MKEKEELKTNNSKAITLIALIITIIVMLILVGVTVAIALNGGLFSQTKVAVKKTQFEIDKERLLSAVIGCVGSDTEVDFDILNKNLPEGFEKMEDGGYRSGAGNTFYVSKHGGISTEKSIEPTMPTVDDYGKYVEYGIDLNKDGNYRNDWKVFYVGSPDDGYSDNNGKIFIIAADYVRGDEGGCTEIQQAIQKAEMLESTNGGYEDFCYYWDKSKIIYDCYDGTNAPVINERTTNKQQCSRPNLFMAAQYCCSYHVGEDGKGGHSSSRMASTLLCNENWQSLVKTDEGALFAIGGPTLEMWVASWNQKHGKSVDETNGITLYANGNNNEVSKSGYSVGITEDATETYYSVKDCSDGYEDTLYFPHNTYYSLDLDFDGESDDACQGYRLASPANYSDNYLMIVDYSGAVNGNNYTGSFIRTSSNYLY